MDPFGNVIRDFLKEKHAASVRNAVSLAMEFKDEGMTKDQLEEILCASGFDREIISEAMDLIPSQKKKKAK
jgi:hypothetical protein